MTLTVTRGNETTQVEDFIHCLLAADHACYPHAADQADLPRLAEVFRRFPEGFCLYSMAAAGGREQIPAGYTGFYPISAATFGKLDINPAALSRGRADIMPVPLKESGNFLYLFNYSLIPQFHGTPDSKGMLARLAADLRAISCAGMAAVTVSAAGARVALKFGLTPSGTLIHDGEAEQVYTARF